jgi:uncharacterized membrane protein (DUF106 family)
MPAEQLELLLENPAMEEALAVVYDRSEEGTAELEWSDVSGDLSSEQWGTLIERGVLVSAGSGFVVADPEALQTQLDEQGTAELEFGEIEPERWAPADKLAGVVVLVLFAGYFVSPLRNAVASAESLVLGPVVNLLPFYWVVLVLAAATGLFSTLVQDRLLDREKLDRYRERMQRLKKRRQAAKERGDEEALEELEAEQLERATDQVGMLKTQFRPTVWIMLLTIPVFLWLRWMVRAGHLGATQGLVLPFAGRVTWQQSLLGPIQTWILWYFLGSVVSRQLFEKLLNFNPSDSS